jgi:predicted RNase H-like nuclease
VRVAGVDGTKGGWVAVVLDDGTFIRDVAIRDIESEFDELADVKVIAIDVPIGFGPRLADTAARAYLVGTASVVFSTPSRAMLERPFGPGLGVSAQAHALGDRILHVTDRATRDDRIYEVHPEVSFRAMNRDHSLQHRKKSAGGALERIELLRAHGIDLTRIRELAKFPLDDVLDAGAAAWSATRIAAGAARTLPDTPETVDGRPVAIWV